MVESTRATAGQTRATARGGALVALRHRDFRLFWTGVALSHIGYDVQRVGLGVLAYRLTGSAFLLALILTGDALPMVVLSPIGGALSDRLNRRLVLVCSRCMVGGSALVVALLTAAGWITTWHLLAYALVAGICYAFDVPARQVLIRDLVPGRDFVNAVALTATLRQASRIVGPAIGSAALLLGGIPATLALMAAGQLGLVALAALVRLSHEPRPRTASASAILGEGLRFIVRHEAVWALLIVAAIPPLFCMAYLALVPVFARDILGRGDAAIGVMLTAAGVGALAGSALVAAYPDRAGRPAGAVIAAASAGLAVAAFAASPGYLPSLALLVAAGAAIAVVTVVTTTAVQQRTPPAMQGRVMGVYQVTWELQVAGALGIGALADLLGAPMALGLAGLAGAAAAVALGVLRPAALRA